MLGADEEALINSSQVTLYLSHLISANPRQEGLADTHLFKDQAVNTPGYTAPWLCQYGTKEASESTTQ